MLSETLPGEVLTLKTVMDPSRVRRYAQTLQHSKSGKDFVSKLTEIDTLISIELFSIELVDIESYFNDGGGGSDSAAHKIQRA
ncbi:hypothetical protein Tco_0154580 [Tanacetum coccineum]